MSISTKDLFFTNGNDTASLSASSEFHMLSKLTAFIVNNCSASILSKGPCSYQTVESLCEQSIAVGERSESITLDIGSCDGSPNFLTTCIGSILKDDCFKDTLFTTEEFLIVTASIIGFLICCCCISLLACAVYAYCDSNSASLWSSNKTNYGAVDRRNIQEQRTNAFGT